ncbi:MAG: hypothetical protein MUE60_12065 [Candidatus Eisenbacteria bacterium]|nr:hypothetical protein [Candidatus Eisenbacteria bacterium]
MTRYLVPGVLITAVLGTALLWPGDGDAGSRKADFTVVYTGDVVGKIEPCG